MSPVIGNSRTIADKQHKEACNHLSAFISVRMNPSSTTLPPSSGRAKSTASIQQPRQHQHQHRSSASKSRSKVSHTARIASSSKPMAKISKTRGPEETDVAGVLASMAALTSSCNSNVTIQAGSSDNGDRNAMQHSVDTILRNSCDDSNTVPLGNFFEAVGTYRSEGGPGSTSTVNITLGPESKGLQDITVSLPSLHQTGNQQERVVTPLHKHELEFSHHSSASVIGLVSEAEDIAMPPKKPSPERSQEASPPIRQQQSRQPEQTSAPEQHTLSLQQRATDQSAPSLTSVPSSSTPQLPRIITSSSTSSPPRLVASPSRCSPLPSQARATGPLHRSPPPKHIEISPGLETGDESLQSPAKRRKTARSPGKVDKPAPPITAPSHAIPPLIMADPEAARITTSIAANSPETAPAPTTSQPLTMGSSEMTDLSVRTIVDHAPLSTIVGSVNGVPWLNTGPQPDRMRPELPVPSVVVHNPSEDNVMRFHRRFLKFKRASKECQRLLDATATAETEHGRYVWFGSPQGMRVLIDSTDRLARNLARLKGYLQEALEAVCSSQKAMASGVILPPLPPVIDIPVLPPVILSSQAQTVIPLMSSIASTDVCSPASLTVSSSDRWVSPNVTQGRNVLGELSVGIDTLAMLIRTPRLRSAEREIPSSSGPLVESPKKYVLSSKGMLESETPNRAKKKSSSQKNSCDVDKLIQWPKHVTGASDDDRLRRSSTGLNDTVRRRLTSDLGPNWKLDKPIGQKRATSESAQAKIKLVNEMDQCSEDFDVELLTRRHRNEDIPRSNSVASLSSDTTIIDDQTSAKEQTGNIQAEIATTEQKSPSTGTVKEGEKDNSAGKVALEKAGQQPDVTVVSNSESTINNDIDVEHGDAVRIDSATEQALESGAAATKITKKLSQESSKQNARQVGSEKPQNSRKRPRESGNSKKDGKKATVSQKPEDASKKIKRPVGRPPLAGKKGTKQGSKGKSAEKEAEAKLKEKPKRKRRKVKENDTESVPALPIEPEQEKTPGELVYVHCIMFGRCQPHPLTVS